ncbi:MAG: hypothetical protein R3192_16600 [Woeseiaceae bacterium]|nr:hypothetical protein [Woeseiaceae bacterium]
MLRKLLALAGAIAALAIGINPVFADHLDASLSIESVARLTSDRLVVFVTGTYKCGPMDTTPNPFVDVTFVNVIVRQASGRVINQGFGGANLICDDTTRSFQAPASDQLLVPWHGGLARVRADIIMQDCDESFDNCHFFNTSVESQIKIRGGTR